jgi:UDPglucose 6-dehydrogenase
VQALHRIAREQGYEARILGAVEGVNDAQKDKLFDLIDRHYGGSLAGRTIAVWGLAFKPNTDDMREAPSRVLLARLWAAGARVRAHDPEAMHEAARLFGEREDLVLCDSPEAALQGADALVLVTEWKAFSSPDFARLAGMLSDKVVFDGRNLFPPDAVEGAGLAYYGIGRGRTLRRGDTP